MGRKRMLFPFIAIVVAILATSLGLMACMESTENGIFYEEEGEEKSDKYSSELFRCQVGEDMSTLGDCFKACDESYQECVKNVDSGQDYCHLAINTDSQDRSDERCVVSKNAYQPRETFWDGRLLQRCEAGWWTTVGDCLEECNNAYQECWESVDSSYYCAIEANIFEIRETCSVFRYKKSQKGCSGESC